MIMTTVFAMFVWMNTLPAPLTPRPEPQQEHGLDPRFQPPPIKTNLGPKIVIATGAALVLTGVIGMAFADDCRTYDAGERCIDPRGGTTLFPTLLVSGIATTITGSYWYRRVDGS